MKKRPGDIIISHKCTKNHNHMLNCSWDMMRDRCDCYFSFWAIFLPFYPPNSPKNKNFKKKKYTLRYHNFTYVYQRLWLDDVRFLRYGVRWMDGRTDRRDRQTEGRTVQKKWHKEVGGPPKYNNFGVFLLWKFAGTIISNSLKTPSTRLTTSPKISVIRLKSVWFDLQYCI